jgi:hypothetical protein
MIPPLPPAAGLLAHVRRWKRHGQRFAVECYRDPIDVVRGHGVILR